VETFERTLSRWCAAEARGDTAALDALLDADFRGDGPEGRVLGKAEWLAQRGGGAFTPTEARVNNRTGVAMGISGACRFTLVAIRRGDRWTVVNVQLGAAIRPPRCGQITHLADVPSAPLHDPACTATSTPKEETMSEVIADMSMSLDGYVADTNGSIDDLAGWMFSGEVEVPTAIPGLSFRVSESSASVLRGAFENVGALLSGRVNFDAAQGWNGQHPMGVPVFVVTHKPPEDWPHAGKGVEFVTDGVESALAQAREAAGDKIVGVATPSMTQQLLDAGLLDGIHINLVPILLGEGVPFFSNLSSVPARLEGPDVVEGDGVTHLSYRVKR
jgi:dihydrofolate reductase